MAEWPWNTGATILRDMLLGRGHTKETGNRNFGELLSDCVEHMELNGTAQIKEITTQLAED
jgi:hypothetical protein